jgi:hypothetical protein
MTGGSADVILADGIKSPNLSLYEENPQTKAITDCWPTVVWEVGYSQSAAKLAYDLARYVACSQARVQLAIGLNIERNPLGPKPRGLKKVTCALWEVDDIEELADPGSQELDRLVRCDSFAEDAEEHVVPPATAFSCITSFEEKYLKFFVSQHDVYTGSAFASRKLPIG